MGEKEIKLPFDLSREVFRWGPVPGKFVFLSVFCEVNFKYFHKKFAGENWSESMYLFKDSRMFFLNNLSDLCSSSQRVFKKFILPTKLRFDIYDEWQSYIKDLENLERKIDGLNLDNLDNPALLDLWNGFHKFYIDFWTNSMVPELANFASDKLLEAELKKHIKDDKDLLSAMEILTAPERLSFYQEEEIDLARTKDIVGHQKKYFWLKNSYNGSEILDKSFFENRKMELKGDIEVSIFERIEQVKQKKQELKGKYNLTQDVMDIAEAISFAVGWQDERKKQIFIAVGYEDLFLNQIVKRFDYDKDELYNAWHWEIADILAGKDMHEKLKTRKFGFGVLYYKTCKNLSSDEVNYYWEVYQERVADGAITELKGLVASKGTVSVVRGMVRILLDPSRVEEFKTGEILVVPMTSPEYIFAIRKSAAIVTDVGGLTQHAAIVSRELNIPCVVGTKIATKVFKNGDEVEVDANIGVIKKT